MVFEAHHSLNSFLTLCCSASPYLLSIGLTKSSMAIVFVAGPLSGLIMQPLIGATQGSGIELITNSF
jgi:hypothetical protein